MNSPLPAQWPGHLFSSWDTGVIGGNALAGSLTGAPTALRGTDPTSYAQAALESWGLIPASSTPAKAPEVGWVAKGAVLAVALVVLIFGMVLLVGPSNIEKAAI